MAVIKKGIKLIMNFISPSHFHLENYRVHYQLEEQNIYLSEEREAHKHISSLKFML